MLERITEIYERYQELTRLLADPEIIGDRDQYKKLAKEHAELEPLARSFLRWKKIKEELEYSRTLLRESDDPEMREVAQFEIDTLKNQEEAVEKELLILLIPKDPSDEKNIILEIRAGTGGDEAALFGGDLFNAYARYAEKQRWKVEIITASESSVGGFKEVIARIQGKGAYSKFKYERGVHRVQRVPRTETQGRIHTSTVTIAVLPEAQEVDIQIQDKDLRIDVFRSSGPGGQSVNTTDSAVRVTHLPTGLVVTCQDEKSQHKNKAKALTVLRARLLDMMRAEQEAQRQDKRKSQIGTGERSKKIRTYNFPQARVTDHRLGLSIYQIDAVLAGNLELFFEPLVAHFQREALK